MHSGCGLFARFVDPSVDLELLTRPSTDIRRENTNVLDRFLIWKEFVRTLNDILASGRNKNHRPQIWLANQTSHGIWLDYKMCPGVWLDTERWTMIDFDSSRRNYPQHPPPPKKKIPSKSKLGYTYFLASVYHIKSFTKQCKMMSLSTKAHIIIYISFLSLIFFVSRRNCEKKNLLKETSTMWFFSCSFHKNSWDIK